MGKRTKLLRKLPPAREEPAMPAATQDAEGAGPAFLDWREREPEAVADLSIEDPLQDWPELEAEKDRWLLERNGGGSEPDR